MEARLEQGYATFSRPPIGYKFVKSSNGGKKIIRDEPLASIVEAALTGYATGRFESQTEVKRFLEAQPEFPKHSANGSITQQRVVDLLTRPIYAGYIGAPKWGIPYRDGKHEALISKSDFKRIREKLERGVYAPARKDIHLDFPLRGAVLCGCCNKPLRAHWTQGKTKKFAYYTCHTTKPEKCEVYGKGIPRAEIEGEFEKLLADIQPSRDLMAIVTEMFRMCWDEMMNQAAGDIQAIKNEVKKVENEINQLIDRAVQATNLKVVSRYEDRIGELEEKKALLNEKAKNPFKPRYSFEELIELSLRFLSNPCGVWRSGRFALQRMVLKLVFSEPLAYSRKNGYRTPKTTLPFKLLEDIAMLKKNMVLPPRVELGTIDAS